MSIDVGLGAVATTKRPGSSSTSIDVELSAVATIKRPGSSSTSIDVGLSADVAAAAMPMI